jgi:hypothetical protein
MPSCKEYEDVNPPWALIKQPSSCTVAADVGSRDGKVNIFGQHSLSGGPRGELRARVNSVTRAAVPCLNFESELAFLDWISSKLSMPTTTTTMTALVMSLAHC